MNYDQLSPPDLGHPETSYAMPVLSTRFHLLLILLLLATFAACKATPSPNAGFILERPEAKLPLDLPFHSAWFKPGVNLNDYDRIMIAKVDTSHLLATTEVLTKGTGDREAQIAELAAYAESAFRRAFQNDPNRRFRVVASRGPRTLNLEIALTEMVSARPIVNAITFLFIYRPVQQGMLAMEGRIRDAKSGAVLVTFSDRENAKLSLIHVDDFNRTGHGKAILDEWAGQLVRVLNRKPGEVIKDPSRFRLSPVPDQPH